MDNYLSKPIQSRALYAAVEGGRSQESGVRDQESVRRRESGVGSRESGVRSPESGVDADGVDWAVALERVGGRKELLHDMAKMLIKECGRLLPLIASSLTDGNAVELRRAAHTLKSAVDWFGARAAVAAAWRLESMGQDGNVGDSEEAHRTLVLEIERIEPQLAACARGEIP
jgi:HPt (histidine-containing phosphotransfer) domain-containing protein